MFWNNERIFTIFGINIIRLEFTFSCLLPSNIFSVYDTNIATESTYEGGVMTSLNLRVTLYLHDIDKYRRFVDVRELFGVSHFCWTCSNNMTEARFFRLFVFSCGGYNYGHLYIRLQTLEATARKCISRSWRIERQFPKWCNVAVRLTKLIGREDLLHTFL